MFNSPTDLTPEPEWLLQSGRADPMLLGEVLSQAFYPFLLDLASDLLKDPDAARLAAVETLAKAIQNAYRFPGETSVRAWLVSWLLLAHPLFRERAAFVLEKRFNWEPAEIARATAFKLPVLRRLYVALHKKDPVLFRPASSSPELPPLDELELERVSAQVARQATQTARRQRRASRVLETGLVGLTILVGLVIFWSSNRIMASGPESMPSIRIGLPTHSPTPLWKQNVAYVVEKGDTLASIAALSGIPERQLQELNQITSTLSIYPGKALWVGVPAVAYPAAAPSLLLDPLTGASSPKQIIERVRQSQQTWHSLWADFQMKTTLSAQNFGAPKQYYRYQLWVIQPFLSNELFGDLSNDAAFRSIIRNGHSYNMAARYSIAYLDRTWNEPMEVLVHSPLLRALVFPGENGLLNPDLGELVVLGQQQIAGRPTVMVEWAAFNQDQVYRLWVDTATGLILRRQEIDPLTGQERYDLIVTQIVLDPQPGIPSGLFDPAVTWPGGFARDYTGENTNFELNDPTPTPAF